MKPEDLIRARGEMADRVRAFDWASTPVGPMEEWPVSLRTAVATLLECQIPMYIAWGEKFIQFYNDACRPMLGTMKHPQALGTPAPQSWPEIWETLGPMWHDVLNGKVIGLNDFKLTIERHGYPEDVYFNISYSPLRDDSGNVSGVLVAYSETTDRLRTERRLNAAQEQLRSMFMQMPAAVAILRGSELRYEFANAAYQMLVAKPEHELVGRKRLEVFPDSSEEIHAQILNVYLTGERLVNREYAFPRDWDNDGRVYDRYLNLVFEPYRDADGIIVGVIVFAFDVSEHVEARRQAQDAEARSRFALEAAGMGEWEYDLRTGTSIRSLRHDQCLGHERMLPSMSYRDFLNGIAPDHRARIDQLLRQAAAQGGSCSFEYPIIWPDKSVHWIASRARADLDASGKAWRMSGLVWDITESRAAHEALREASRQKDEFLATLAHELRNPLAPIRNAAHALGQRELSPAGLAWCRDVITRQVQHMALLLDDLLDVSRMTTGRIELKKETVQLEAVVNAAVESVAPLISKKKHALQVSLPREAVELEADPLRLAQVFTNLLTNAAKYTDPQGRIELKAVVDDQGLLVTLSDNGVGVAPEALPNLFRMFSQIPSAIDRSEGGLGIGLALSKGLVTLHGGSLNAHSAGPGCGTTFELRLPASVIRMPAPRERPLRDVDEARPTHRRVLVVDDNRDVADSLAMLLEIEGHDVTVAYGARHALSLGPGTLPEVAFLDIGMPDMNGYELARQIRLEPWGASMFLVAVTGWGQEDDRRRAAAAGFDRHLTKPVNPSEVLALLSRRTS
ncbi:MAG TPA: PAS domain-containing protein [Ramlibacter sp.]|nr:PAS domain-containing protein [Ramlibacter sp.]